MSNFDWKCFLKRWSQEMIESMGNERNKLPPAVIESGWLGYPGATEEQIAQAETRLGTALPPSYRAFLKVTNGWRQMTPFIYRLWSTEEIDWFTVRHPDWLDTLLEKSRYLSPTAPNVSSPLPSIPDEDYFVYGDEQDCRKIRVEYLQTALEISQRGEAAIYLLNPQIVTEAGEWEAWFLGDWLPGADRYRSFQDMMQAEYENFLELRETPAVPVSTAIMERSNHLSVPSDMLSQSKTTPSNMKNFSNERLEIPFEKPFEKNDVQPILEISDEWGEVASFTVEIQSKHGEKHSEQRTIARHIETETIAIYPNIDTKTVQRWISAQLKVIINQSLEETVDLEITQLRMIRAPYTETEMMVDRAHPLFSAPIAIGEPFTLEVSMNIVGSTAVNLAERQLVYQTQCFAHNLSTQIKTCLGDVITKAPIADRPIYTARFPEITLHKPGIYRLTIWVTLQNMTASPGYFKVPMLQVV
ncbi:MAG: SMI1/KNR4 family protein [Synechococcales cyanobacterium M58_A2018_015]|nr:SMI1/KNR4 family protein [Synechococcales cyanobacterium M58_A2018_015]